MRIPARIADISWGTPTVKAFRLDLSGWDFSFFPGQWVDCFLREDATDEAAGYSMTSSPLSRGAIELAVKKIGENPVTLHLHERARVGDTIYVKGGQGDCYYLRGMGDSLVLVGGGIGITPLMSIVRYVDEAVDDVSVRLVYSAKTPSELLFRRELAEIARRNDRIACRFVTTQPSSEPWDGPVGRMDSELLRRVGAGQDDLYYVCGPPAMIEFMAAEIRELGVPDAMVKYELW